MAWRTSSLAGRTSWTITLPSRRKMSVGQSLTRKERPSSLPRPSAMRTCCTCGYSLSNTSTVAESVWQ